jgi:hypothetical protein
MKIEDNKENKDNSDIPIIFYFEPDGISKEQYFQIEKYYLSVYNKVTNITNIFLDEIFERNAGNKYINFFLYWITIILAEEKLAHEILEKVSTIPVYNEIITKQTRDSIPMSKMNRYAFAMATKYNFENYLSIVILKQGKLMITLEWLFEKLKSGNFELVEASLSAANYCYLLTNELKNKYLPYIKNFINKDISEQKTNTIFNILKKTSSKNITRRHKTKKLTASSQKELKDLADEGQSKLTINKIIILADIIARESPTVTEDKDIVRAVCLFDRDKKMSSRVLDGLYLTKNKKLTLELLEAGLIGVNLNVFQTALNQKDMKFILQFYEMYHEERFFDNEDFHNELIYLIHEDINNIEIYLFLIRKLLKTFSINSIKILVKIIEDTLDITNDYLTILKILSNPIKIFVLVAEILKLSLSNFSMLEYNLNRLISKSLDFSLKLQNLIEEDIIFREILLEKDLDGRILLDIISMNNFVILLKNKLVEKICDDLLAGPYSIQGGLLETSSQFKSLETDSFCKDYDVFTKQRISLKKYSPEKFKTNNTHFMVWRKNAYGKYNLKLFINILIVISYQILCLYLIYVYRNLMNNYSNINDINALDKIISAFLATSEGDYYYKTGNFVQGTNVNFINSVDEVRQMYTSFQENICFVQTFFYYTFLIYFYYVLIPINYIYRIIYWYKSARPSLGLTFIADIILFFLSLILLAQDGIQYNINIDEIIAAVNNKLISREYLQTFSVDLILFKPEDNPLQINFIKYSIFSIFLWIKLVNIIRSTKTFGPVVVIFFLSIKGIMGYLILFLISCFVFGSIGMMNYFILNGDKTYKNIFYTYIRFFITSTGQDPLYDTYTSDSAESKYPYFPYTSGILIVVVMILNAVVLVNLIIAVLTNIYERYYTNAIQLFIQKRLEIKKKYSTDDERYDSLLVNIYPFNIVSFPLAFGFLFMKNITHVNLLNLIILKINYLFFAFGSVIIYSLITLLLIPFTYLKIVFAKFVQLFVKDSQKYFTIYKLVSLLLYLCFGLLLQLKAWVYDIIIFCFELERKSIPLTTENENVGRYSLNKFLLKLIRKLKFQYDGELKIPIDMLIKIIDKLINEEDSQTMIEDLLYSSAIERLPKKPNDKEPFNIYHNDLIKRYENKGINYLAFVDYLYNFVDEKDVINLNVLIDMLEVNYKNIKMRTYYKFISDKSYRINLSQKQFQFQYRVEKYLKTDQQTDNNARIETTPSNNIVNTNNNEAGKLITGKKEQRKTILTKYLEKKRRESTQENEADSKIHNVIESSPLRKRKGFFFKNDKINFLAFKSLLLRSENKRNKQNKQPSMLKVVKMPIISVSVLDKFISGISESEISKQILENIQSNNIKENPNNEKYFEAKFKAMEKKMENLEETNSKLLKLMEEFVYFNKRNNNNNSGILNSEDVEIMSKYSKN